MSERFCSVYLCMHFPLDVFCQDKKQHNFNTNLCFDAAKCLLRWISVLFLQLQSTSLVAFLERRVAGVGNLIVFLCNMRDYVPLRTNFYSLHFNLHIKYAFNKMCHVNEEEWCLYRRWHPFWVGKYDWQHAMFEVEKVQNVRWKIVSCVHDIQL